MLYYTFKFIVFITQLNQNNNLLFFRSHKFFADEM
jgi:hypothetical protein